MFTIDYSALDRLLGADVAEQYGVTVENRLDGDLMAPSALLAMAVEQAAASKQSVADTMAVLLTLVEQNQVDY